MNIIADTNTLISATFWYGDSFEIIGMAESKKLDLILSKSIVKEFFGVLHYDEIREKIKDKNVKNHPSETGGMFLLAMTLRGF